MLKPLVGCALVLAGLSLGAALYPTRRAAPPSPIAATADLGAVVTTTLTLDNAGQPESVAQLYEALEPPPTPTPAPASPLPPLPALSVPLPDKPGPISVELLTALDAAPDGQSEMLVYMTDQADLSAAATTADWNERGQAVMKALREHAARTQAPLLAALRAAGHSPRPYWIVNMLTVRGDLSLAQWLGAQPGVALVDANSTYVLDDWQAETPQTTTTTLEPAWGLAKINAPAVWGDWGVRGEVIVVANLDTGVAYTHTALLPAYRGWSPTGLDHNYNWYDPTSEEEPALEPVDLVGHGTHTLGTLVGQATATSGAVGVAPGARWIAVRGCASLFCDNASLIAGAQWLLAPTDLNGENPRPDLRPHIVNNSWGGQSEDSWYTGYVEAWNASGIFSVFATGNNGVWGGCESSYTPGAYASAFAVGATDSADLIADFSSRGPTSDGRVKPDVSAPGVSIPSAWLDGTYATADGTSMATPHVAGVAALLWSANPALVGDLAATQAIITSTTLGLTSMECGDAPDAIPNNVYGWGRLDAHRAVLAARVEVPWLSLPPTVTLPADGSADVVVTLDARQVTGPGQYRARILTLNQGITTSVPVTFSVQAAANTALLTGRLHDRWSGGGIYGQVTAGGGPEARTDASGAYTLTLPHGEYSLTASAFGYLSSTTTLSLTVPSTHEITLTADLPHLQMTIPPLSATLPFAARQSTPLTLSNLGPQTLTVSAAVPILEWSMAEDAPGVTLYDLSAFPPLPLDDDMIYTYTLKPGFAIPIYGAMVDELYLSSNGWVSASETTVAQSWPACLPTYKLPPGSLAPFWADLDPSQGGKVRAGAVMSDTFVVSFEGVPPWSEAPDPAPPTYTFQLALHADGRVQFIYGALGALPEKWAIGVSQDVTRGQGLACQTKPLLLAGRSWSWLNQPAPGNWLSAAPTDLIVPPESSATLTATLSGLGYVPWRTEPFAALIRLTTNDPAQPVVDIPATASVGAPPYRFWMPIVGR
jgi:subtilisin family serine protease